MHSVLTRVAVIRAMIYYSFCKTYTGCLSNISRWNLPKGVLYNVQVGTAPAGACLSGDKKVSFVNATYINSLETRLAKIEKLLTNVTRSGNDIYVNRANVHITSGSGKTDGAVNGLGNLIIGYNELKPSNNYRTGSHNLIMGRGNNYKSYGGIVAGLWNEISGPYASVSGGADNIASGQESSISGGQGNKASGVISSVSGGSSNIASGWYSSAGGGYSNTAGGQFSSVSGGGQNKASGDYSSVSGGYINTASNYSSSVSGGGQNTARGQYSSISGGSYNLANNTDASVSGGHFNTANGYRSSVSGGYNNKAGDYVTGIDGEIFMGGSYSSVSGGASNTATGSYSSISGGNSRSAAGTYNWAAGGLFQYS